MFYKISDLHDFVFNFFLRKQVFDKMSVHLVQTNLIAGPPVIGIHSAEAGFRHGPFSEDKY